MINHHIIFEEIKKQIDILTEEEKTLLIDYLHSLIDPPSVEEELRQAWKKREKEAQERGIPTDNFGNFEPSEKMKEEWKRREKEAVRRALYNNRG